MYPALQIANKLIENGVEEQNLLTHLKLQKAIYLAHGLFLAKTGTPLIFEYFEAWKLGPVVRSVYNQYKDFGGRPIDRLTPISYNHTADSNEHVKWAIFNAWNVVKNMDAITLSNWTHAQDSPWDKAIKNNSEYISTQELEQYFKKVFKIQAVA